MFLYEGPDTEVRNLDWVWWCFVGVFIGLIALCIIKTC